MLACLEQVPLPLSLSPLVLHQQTPLQSLEIVLKQFDDLTADTHELAVSVCRTYQGLEFEDAVLLSTLSRLEDDFVKRLQPTVLL